MTKRRWLLAGLGLMLCGFAVGIAVVGFIFWRGAPPPLRDRVLYWDADLASILAAELSLPGTDTNAQIWYRARIQEVLEDERGWQAASVDFRYVGSARRPDIFFEVLEEEEMFQDRCGKPPVPRGGGDGLGGCAKLSSLDGRTQCRVVVLTWLVLYPEIFASVLYHELGHCFGLRHTKFGLMTSRTDYSAYVRGESSIQYPSNEELAWLRERLDGHSAG